MVLARKKISHHFFKKVIFTPNTNACQFGFIFVEIGG
jgi:hypothetical protein